MNCNAGEPASRGDKDLAQYAMALAVYTIATLVLAWPWVSSAVGIPYDAKSQFYPPFAFLARSLAAGQSPLWTPNIFAGWPQIADPQSLIFSPFFFVAALLKGNPTPHFFDVVVFVLIYIGGLGVFFYFRDRGWHAGGAIIAALGFAFGGAMASRIQHIGQVESLAFLPLALFTMARALERSSWRTGIFAGIFCGCIALGRNQVSLLAAYAIIGFVVWHWCQGPCRRARVRDSLKPLVVCGLVSVSIVIVPVTMTILLAADSNRPEIGYVFAGRGSLHPTSFLMLVFPDLFGASDFAREFWGGPSYHWHEIFGQSDLFLPQNAGQIYIGAVPILAVLGFGLLSGQLWTRDIRYFTVALLGFGIYALGKYTPGFFLIYEMLPGVKLFRRPADATFLFCAILSVVAGYVVHRRLRDAIPPAPPWHYVVFIIIGMGLTVLAAGLAAYMGQLQSSLAAILAAFGFALGAIAILYWMPRWGSRNAFVGIIFLGAVSVIDLAWNNAPDESTGLPQGQFEYLRSDTTNETISIIKGRLAATSAPDRRDRIELIGIGYHWPNIGMIHDLDHLFGHNPLRLADFAKATAAPDTVAAIDQRTFTKLLHSYRSGLEDQFGVRLIATGVPIEQIDPSLGPGDFPLIARTADAFVYENPRALPRVQLLQDWRQADFAQLIMEGEWPDFDARRTVLLEHPPKYALNGMTGGSVRIRSYTNTVIEIEADAPAGGILVLNDIWHPWWRARIDGESTEMLRTNVLFRGVEVPPGEHIVRFEFHPFTGALEQLAEKFSAGRN